MKRAMMAASPGKGPAFTNPWESTAAIALSLEEKSAREVTSEVVPSAQWATTPRVWVARGSNSLRSGETEIFTKEGDSLGVRGPPALIQAFRTL